MAIIILSRTHFVNQRILSQVDKLAINRACTRSDVVRDILYSSFKYYPPQRTPDQIESMYTIEASAERERGKDKCIAVVIDTKFQDILMQYHALRRGNFNRTVEHILCNYLRISPESADTGFNDSAVRTLCLACLMDPSKTAPAKPEERNYMKGHVYARKPHQAKASER